MLKPFALALVLAMVAPSLASAQSLTLNRVKSMLAELGLKPSSEKDGVTIADLGDNHADVRFTLLGDKGMLNIYANWAIPADKQGAIPSLDMLKANNNAPFAFALYGKPGDLSFDLEASFDAALVNKSMLRKSVDQLVSMIDATADLWDTDKWPAPAAPTPAKVTAPAPASVMAAAKPEPLTFAQAQAAMRAAWEREPMRFTNATYEQGKAPDFGLFTPRASSVYKRGDTALIYLEPAGFLWGKPKDGVYTFGFVIDIGLKSKEGALDIDVPHFLEVPLSNAHEMTNVFANLSLTLKDTLPLGDYTLRFTAHDINSTKTATVEMPLTLTQ